MAFLSAIGLMAFASVTEASAGPEELAAANINASQPTATAEELQGRALTLSDPRRPYTRFGRQWENVEDRYPGGNREVAWNDDFRLRQECKYHDDCEVNYLCTLVEIHDNYSQAHIGISFRCVKLDGFGPKFIQHNHYAIPILATAGFTHILLWISAISDRPGLARNSSFRRKNTPGDLVKLGAMILQIVSIGLLYADRFMGAGELSHMQPVADGLFVFSLLGYLYGEKAASKERKVNILAAKANVVVAILSLIPFSIFSIFANTGFLIYRSPKQTVVER